MSIPQSTYYLTDNTTSAGDNTASSNQSAILHMSSSDPDLISHPPITSQPSGGQPHRVHSDTWTYTPSGPRPLNRSDAHGSSISMNSHGNANGKQTWQQTEIDAPPPKIPSQSHVTVTMTSSSVATAGSRDWSRGLFGAFRDFKKSKDKCSAFKIFCQECFCVPCMMCSVAKSLGDKSYLPFIPGTGAAIRFKVRILGGIQGSIATDCLVTSCCCPCAVCQMHREIDDIGLAPT